MTEHQEKLLEIVDAIDELCKKEKITYVMLGGTMLGAYRHRGFIPWDDDVDLGMPREDYERFLKTAEKKLPHPFILRHFSVEQGVPYAFAHIENRNTTYIEARRSGSGYVGGVYVELFPLDVAPEGEWKRRLRELQIKFQKLRLYSMIMEKKREKGSLIRRFVIAILRATASRDAVVRRMDALLQRDRKTVCRRTKGNVCGNIKNTQVCYGNLLGRWGRRENIPGTVLFPTREYSFETKRLSGVCRPEDYLSALYGEDYMIPTPPEQRENGKHAPSYANLREPYSLLLKKKE